MEDVLVTWWRYLPSRIDPNLLQYGAFQIRYYSLMYLVAFGLTYVLVSYRLRTEGYPYDRETVQDSFLWGIIGLILGARLGYVLFYNPAYYLGHPLEVILPFQCDGGLRFVGISGMSYHGGALGVFAAGLLFCRARKIDFWRYADLICPAIPLGYTFGRIGNFLNGELFGRVTTVPWGMVFPLDPSQQLRHPSQLYEAFFEGIVLFAILWAIRRRSPFDGFLLALYIAGYGTIRFFLEYFREPDEQLGLLWGTVSMGQVLCLAMVLLAAGILVARRRAARTAGQQTKR